MCVLCIHSRLLLVVIVVVVLCSGTAWIEWNWTELPPWGLIKPSELWIGVLVTISIFFSSVHTWGVWHQILSQHHAGWLAGISGQRPDETQNTRKYSSIMVIKAWTSRKWGIKCPILNGGFYFGRATLLNISWVNLVKVLVRDEKGGKMTDKVRQECQWKERWTWREMMCAYLEQKSGGVVSFH